MFIILPYFHTNTFTESRNTDSIAPPPSSLDDIDEYDDDDDGTICYLNLRDNTGQIVGRITSLAVLREEERLLVPTLGPEVDAQVDSFGYRAHLLVGS